MAAVFLYQITFLQQNAAALLLELYFNDSMQTVRARRRRLQSRKRGRRWGRWADGADVVFTDTVQLIYSYKTLISTMMEYSSDNVSVAHGTNSSS